MKTKHIEQLMEAQDILTSVYMDIEDRRGYARIRERLDTIRGKLYNLISEETAEEVRKCRS